MNWANLFWSGLSSFVCLTLFYGQSRFYERKMIKPANDVSRSLKKSFSIKKGGLYDGQKYLKIKNIDVLEVSSCEGANAIVYKGKDRLLDRDVAIKVWCRIDRTEKDRLPPVQ